MLRNTNNRSGTFAIACAVLAGVMFASPGTAVAQPGSSEDSAGKRGMLDRVNKELSDLQSRIASLQTKISSSKDRGDDLESKIDDLREEMDEMKTQLNTTRTELEGTRKRLVQEMLIDTDLVQKESKLADDNDELMQLRRKLLAPIQGKYSFKKMMEERKQMDEDLELARADNEFKKVGEISTSILEMDSKIEKYQLRELMKDKEFASLSKRVEKLDKEVREVRATIDKAINDDPVVRDLDSEVKELERSITQRSASNHSLLNDRRKIMTEASRARSEIPRLERQISGLKVKKEQLETALAHDLVVTN